MSAGATIRALVVDDEPLARRRLCRLLGAEPDVVVVGECGDGASALDALTALAPDLVFLDVRMPGLDGLNVLEASGAQRGAEVIVVTAYDRYAVPAFARHALDYLLKPVSPERFRDALGYARRRLGRRQVERTADRLLVRRRGRRYFLPVADVEWLEADRNHVMVHAIGASHRVRAGIGHLAARLDARFRRVSRSAVVNLDRVREILPGHRGDGLIVLRSGTCVRLSRRYRLHLLARSA